MKTNGMKRFLLIQTVFRTGTQNTPQTTEPIDFPGENSYYYTNFQGNLNFL